MSSRRSHGIEETRSALVRRTRGPDLRALRGSGRGLWGRSPAATLEKLRGEWS